MKNILYTIILSFLFSSTASAEIYKWVDDEGKVHYGEKAPNNAASKTVETIKTKDSVSADFQAGMDAYNAGDFQTALKNWIPLAEQGDAKAQNNLGQMYKLRGKGFRNDDKEAVKWFHRAAEQGFVDAQNNLGQMYFYGRGVKKDLAIAYMWLNIATNSGNKTAKQYKYPVERKMTSEQITKAEKLSHECIKKNYKDCVNFSFKTVETIKTKYSVSADSQAAFDAFNKGDYATSLKIYRVAAEQGDIMAQFTLGQAYRSPGRSGDPGKFGVTKDYKEAVKWYRLAAEQGEDIAQFELGRMYKKGQGVTRNLVIAHMWFNTATFSNVEAWTPSMSLVKHKNLSEEDLMKLWRKMKKKEVERLESEMTSEQIAEAKELARECIKKNYKNCVNSSLNIEKAPNKTTDKTVETIKTKDSVSADFQAIVDAYEAGDYETVYREIKLFAEQGDARAQRILGLMYYEGKGVTQDDKEAVKWYRLAAEQGFADAQYNLGVMYYEGKGVTQDDKEAVKWFRLAAEQGYERAQRSLDVMY